MNRRGFFGVTLAGLGGFLFSEKLQGELIHNAGLTHCKMTELVFMHDNQVVCTCLPFGRHLIPSPSSTARVFGQDTILHVASIWSRKEYTIDISDPDNKIIQFNRAYKKPFYYVRRDERWFMI